MSKSHRPGCALTTGVGGCLVLIALLLVLGYFVSQMGEQVGGQALGSATVELESVALRWTGTAFEVQNTSGERWDRCTLTIDYGLSGWSYGPIGIRPGTSELPAREFTKDGERFDPLRRKPDRLMIDCGSQGVAEFKVR